MAEEAGAGLARRLADGARLALFAVTAAILALDLPTMLTDTHAYRPFPLEATTYAILVAVTAVAAPFVLRRRPWGRFRWPLLTAALLGNLAATAAMAPPELFGTAHWAWDIFGWWAVLFLLDRPPWELLAVLVAHLGITLAQVIAAGRADRPTLVGMGISGLALGGLPVAARLVKAAADRAAAIAARAAAETERVRTTERVAAGIHQDRQSRYADLTATAGPLLARLAAGELDPGCPAVRRDFFVQAAHVRRLFAESDDSDDPLVHELTACADIAQRRGLVVTVAVRGARPPVPAASRRVLADAVVQALASARASARITVIGGDGRVTVTVVADVEPGPVASVATRAGPDAGDVRIDWDRRGPVLWMEAEVR
jgi:hypothetical protein